MGDAVGPVTRDRTLDVIRAVATVRVVVFHTSGEARWSWVAAMPLMFFVGGALFAASLDRRSAREVLPQRLRRIIIPLWVWGLLVAVTLTAAGSWTTGPWWGIPGFLVPILPAVGPGKAGDPLYWTWMGLWYINAYIVFMLVGVPLRKLQQRAPRATLMLLFGPVLISGLTRIPTIGALTANLGFWVVGYLYHDNRHRLPSTFKLASVAVCSGAAGLAYALAITGTHVTVTAIPILTATIGLAWVAAALAAGPLLRRALTFPLVDRTVEFIQQRAMTIYLWHAAAIGLAGAMAVRFPLIRSSMSTRVAIVLVFTFLFTLAIGWVEDFAANRQLRLWPLQSRAIDLTLRPDVVALGSAGAAERYPTSPNIA